MKILWPVPADVWRAFLSALATVVLLVAMEGAVLMGLGREWGYRLVSDPGRAGRPIDFAVCHGCDRGVALVRVLPEDPRDPYQWLMAVQGLEPSTASLEVPWPGPAPRSIVAIPGSSRALIACVHGEIYVMDALAPRLPPRLIGRHEPGCVDALACSADGRRMVSLGRDGLSAWDLASERVIWRRTDLCWRSAAFHPDALRLAAGIEDGTLLELDAVTGATTRNVTSLSGAPFQLDFSADGRRLAAMCGELTAVLLDWASGETRWSRAHRYAPLTFSPRGDLLATFEYDQRGWSVALWDADTGSEVAAMTGHEWTILWACFARDGLVYSWGLDGTIRQWDPHLNQQRLLLPVLPASRAS